MVRYPYPVSGKLTTTIFLGGGGEKIALDPPPPPPRDFFRAAVVEHLPWNKILHTSLTVKYLKWRTHLTEVCTRVGWKVHRLTKKELCHSNETWHALNQIFPDTNCIVSFQINPHWISNSGLWKVELETFCGEWPGKLTNGVLCHQDNAPAHKSLVAMTALHDCGFELAAHPPYSPALAPSDYILFPNVKKTLGWEAVSDRWWDHIDSWGLFQGSGWELLIPQESKHCNTDERSVWTAGEPLLKYKHLVKFNHCITVGLWTFQPTLVWD